MDRRIISVRHVRLVAEINEAFACEIRHAVRASRPGQVMVTIMCLDGLEDRQSTHARIKDADGQVAEVSAIIRRDEAGGDVTQRVGLSMGDCCDNDVVRCTRPDRKNAEQRETEDRLHIRCGRCGRRAGPAESECKGLPMGYSRPRRRTRPR